MFALDLKLCCVSESNLRHIGYLSCLISLSSNLGLLKFPRESILSWIKRAFTDPEVLVAMQIIRDTSFANCRPLPDCVIWCHCRLPPPLS